MASRQKSCIQCAEAKRRCDPQLPQCGRCIRRGLRCKYRNLPLSGPRVARVPGNDHVQPDRGRVQAFADSCLCTGTGSTSSLHLDTKPTPGLLSKLRFDSAETVISPESYRSEIQRSPGYPIIAKLDAWSLDTLIQHIGSWPDTFVHSLETPFLHSYAYDEGSLPLPLEAAFR